MMCQNYKPTKPEREAILRAFEAVAPLFRSDFERDKLAKQEASGYGNRNDSVPLICARAMMLNWIDIGANSQDLLLRDWYACRPVAVYCAGLGAFYTRDDSRFTAELSNLVAAAAAAHKAAFQRMLETNRKAA